MLTKFCKCLHFITRQNITNTKLKFFAKLSKRRVKNQSMIDKLVQIISINSAIFEESGYL